MDHELYIHPSGILLGAAVSDTHSLTMIHCGLGCDLCCSSKPTLSLDTKSFRLSFDQGGVWVPKHLLQLPEGAERKQRDIISIIHRS